MGAVYRLHGVVKRYAGSGVGFRLVVRDLNIAPGDKVALVGQSGCGKSTLLDLLAMVLRPEAGGEFRFAPQGAAEEDVGRLWARGAQDRLGDLRRRHIGYVLQTGGLLPFLTVEENIRLPRRLLGLPEDGTVEDLARQLDILSQLGKKPSLLSAGQRQRTAIGRALAHRPSVVLADEPTASLDPVNGRRVLALLVELAQALGVTVVVASHDWDRVAELQFRRLVHRARAVEGGTATESVFTG